MATAADGERDSKQELLLLARVKAQLAVARMRRRAAEQGLDRLRAEEIEAEIQQARLEQRESRI
jgi:hypothetical protein